MQGLSRRDRALGTHWWNPPFLVPLVEVIETQWTSAPTVAWTMALHEAAGKKPAHVKKDVPGFIGNRLQHALWREAISLVEQGICDAQTVDDVVKASFGRRLPVLGPLENADLVGTDLTLAIHHIVLPAIDSRPEPSPYLKKLVAEKKLGFKTGEGFRRWSPAEQAALRARVMQHLKSMASASLRPGHRQKGLLDRRRTGAGDKSRRSSIGEDFAAMEHDDAIGVRHLVAQMRRPQHGDRALRPQAQHQLQEVAAAPRIEADRRLVHEQHPRLVQQRPGKLERGGDCRR